MRRALLLAMLAIGCARSHLADGSLASLDSSVPLDSFVPPASNGVVESLCGPTDGIAWAMAVTESPVSCATIMTPTGTTISIVFFADLTTTPSVGTTFPIGFSSGNSIVARCTDPMTCHTAISGSATLDRFTNNVEIAAHWSVTFDDGTLDSGQARVTQFCPTMTPHC